MPKYLINSQETWAIEAESEDDAIDLLGWAKRNHGTDLSRPGKQLEDGSVRFVDQDIMFVAVEDE